MKNVCSTWQLVTLGALAALACAPDDSDPNQWGTGGMVQGSGGSSTGGSSTSTGGYRASGGTGTGGSAAASGSGGSAASGSGGSAAATGSGGAGAAVGSGGTAAGGTAGGGTASGGTATATGGVATGTGGVVTGTGGTVTATGGTAAGTGGAATGECSNTDTSLLTIDSARRVNSNCNTAGVQGWWYCFSDGTTMVCPTDDTLYNATSGGLCISGTTTAVAANYGAGIGLALNQAATTGAAKTAFNATTAGVTGFRITLTGSTGGVPLRLMLTTWATAPANSVAPFKEIPALAGASTVVDFLISDAIVPADWDVANAGAVADPASLFDLQVQIPGDSVAAAFNFCITSVQLI